jgi:ABC-type sugar transport system substrate-binding protein
LLEGYDGIIIAINVPPDENAMVRLKGKLRGYVGMNEIGAGMKTAERLFASSRGFDCIYVPNDKPEHYGYSLRIKGIKEVAQRYGVPVCEIDINDRKSPEIICRLMDESAFISLGPVGTAFALKAKKDYPDKVRGIVAIDLNQETADAIRDGSVICTVIQYPRGQGRLSAKLAADILAGKETSAFTTIDCGPAVIDRSSIAIS